MLTRAAEEANALRIICRVHKRKPGERCTKRTLCCEPRIEHGELCWLREQFLSQRLEIERRDRIEEERERIRAADRQRRDELDRFPGAGAG